MIQHSRSMRSLLDENEAEIEAVVTSGNLTIRERKLVDRLFALTVAVRNQHIASVDCDTCPFKMISEGIAAIQPDIDIRSRFNRFLERIA